MPNPDSPEVSDGTITKLPRWGILEWFVVLLTVLPAILYFPGTQKLRVVIRILPFLLSLILLLRLLGLREAGMRLPRHPSQIWLIYSMLYLLLMILHPTTNSMMSALAQVMLYLAVLAPLFWAPSLVKTPRQLERLLWILLLCNGVNAIVGILQVYDPGTWMPKEISDVVINSYISGVEGLTYEGPLGQRVLRPPGLSDNPGAVSAPGMYAALLGAIFAVGPSALWKKALSLIFALSGIMIIYLTQVRTCLMILAGMAVVYGLRLFLSRWKLRGALFLILALMLNAASFRMALNAGGESITKRFALIFTSTPMKAYTEAGRYSQLKAGVTDFIVEYPLGAGLGRWGMMHYYFGNPMNPDSPQLWAELQIPCWVLDGGVILLFCYSLALVAATLNNFRFASSTNLPGVQYWAYAAFAFNVGTVALCFGFTPFTTQAGMQYWFLIAAVHGASSILARQTHGSNPPS